MIWRRRKYRKTNVARRAREATGLTMREFAKLLDVSLSVVARWEQGGVPSAPSRALLQIVADYPAEAQDALSGGLDPT